MIQASVIIPSRNRKEYVLDLLSDLRNQTFQDFETIVVDQSDRYYFLTDCKYIQDTEVGPNRARKIGIENASADIIMFLDDDIRVNSDYIEQLVRPILNKETVVTAGSICDAQGNYKKTPVNPYYNKDLFVYALFKNPNSPYHRHTLAFPYGCSAILKSVYNEIGGTDLYFDPHSSGDDYDVAFRLLIHGYTIKYIPEAKIMHLKAENGGRRGVFSKNGVSSLHYNLCYSIYKNFGIAPFREYKLVWMYHILRSRKFSLYTLKYLYRILRLKPQMFPAQV